MLIRNLFQRTLFLSFILGGASLSSHNFSPIRFNVLDSFIDIFYEERFETILKKANVRECSDKDVLEIVSQSNLGRKKKLSVWALEDQNDVNVVSIAFAIGSKHIFISKNFNEYLQKIAMDEALNQAMTDAYSSTSHALESLSYEEFARENSFHSFYNDTLTNPLYNKYYHFFQNELRKNILAKARDTFPKILFNLKKFIILHEIKHLEFNHCRKKTAGLVVGRSLGLLAFLSSVYLTYSKNKVNKTLQSSNTSWNANDSFLASDILYVHTPAILGSLISFYFSSSYYSHQQEFQADAEAVKEGGVCSGEGALLFFTSPHLHLFPEKESFTHPSPKERADRIRIIMTQLKK